jgi:hypothetical protein
LFDLFLHFTQIEAGDGGIDALYTTVGFGSALGGCPHVHRAMQETFASGV